MKRFKSVIGIILVLSLVISFAACGNAQSDSEEQGGAKQNDSSDQGGSVNPYANRVINENGVISYLFRYNEEDELGTPEKEVDPQSVYKNLTYTPEMFYGEYRLAGGEDALNAYRSEMDYMDYDLHYSKQLTAIPYRLRTGKESHPSYINYVEEYNWTEAYFQNENGSLHTLTCAYEISGSTITLRPLDDWEVDDENNKITYSFTDVELTYEFSFSGRDLTLSKDGKSVTMRSGLAVYTDDPHLYVDCFVSPGSEQLGDIVRMEFLYSNPEEYKPVVYLYSDNIHEITDYHAVLKLSDDGRFTLTVPTETGTQTYQFVYFYGHEDGLVLTDGTTTYYYNDTYADYNKWELNQYVSEDDTQKLEELDDYQLEVIVEKKENLVEDLTAAFEAAGIQVAVNEETGEMMMDASILFGGDSAVLTDAGKEFLNKFIGAYTEIVFNEKYNGFISKTIIEGHTAPIVNSTYETGLPLSIERANAVKDYCLSAESGVNPEYIDALSAAMEAVGMSNTTPVYDQEGNVDLDASRRVSFRFIINIE